MKRRRNERCCRESAGRSAGTWRAAEEDSIVMVISRTRASGPWTILQCLLRLALSSEYEAVPPLRQQAPCHGAICTRVLQRFESQTDPQTASAVYRPADQPCSKPR